MGALVLGRRWGSCPGEEGRALVLGRRVGLLSWGGGWGSCLGEEGRALVLGRRQELLIVLSILDCLRGKHTNQEEHVSSGEGGGGG